jgi:6-pyruvoyl-tetrahydropterin synthase
VQTFTKATASFDAGHKADLPVRCQKPHGHCFQVSAVVSGKFDPGIQQDLEVLLREFDGRDINSMLVAGDPSVMGIANWIMERLLGAHSGLVKVEVEDSKGLAGTSTREIR